MPGRPEKPDDPRPPFLAPVGIGVEVEIVHPHVSLRSNLHFGGFDAAVIAAAVRDPNGLPDTPDPSHGRVRRFRTVDVGGGPRRARIVLEITRPAAPGDAGAVLVITMVPEDE